MKLLAASLLAGALLTPSGPTERVTVFVELTSVAAVDTATVTQARSARERTSAQASRVVSRSGGREVARTSNAVPGVVLATEKSRLPALSRMPEVRAALNDPALFARGPLAVARDTADDQRPAFVVQDGMYVSARWPGDAYLFAQKFKALLDAARGPAAVPAPGHQSPDPAHDVAGKVVAD